MPMKTIEGYSKEKYTDTSVLLAGGGAKALSDFVGTLSWDSTNKKIQYTPIGGTATDLVTLSWNNISGKPDSFTPSAHNHNGTYVKVTGDTMTGSLYIKYDTDTYHLFELRNDSGDQYIEADSSRVFKVGFRGGVYPLIVDPNNKVGIGINPPTYKLDVNGDIHTSGKLVIDQSGGLYSGPSTAQLRKIYGCDSSNSGYTKMASYAMLPDNDSDDAWQVRPWSGAFNDSYITVLHGGNTGVGTTTPKAKLHVTASPGEALRLSMTSGNYTAGAGPKITFRHGDTGEELAFVQGCFNSSSQGNYGNLLLGTRTSDAAGTSTKVTVLYNGDVGIGTSPSYKLDVYGGKAVARSNVNTVQLIPNADCGLYMTTSGQWIHIAGSGGTMYMYNGAWDNAGAANYNKGIAIDSSNNITIGNTLSVTNTATFNSSTVFKSSPYFRWGGTTSDMWLYFQDKDSTETVYLGIRKPIASYGPTYYVSGNYYRLIHEGNIGSQTVGSASYADSAGSASSANKVANSLSWTNSSGSTQTFNGSSAVTINGIYTAYNATNATYATYVQTTKSTSAAWRYLTFVDSNNDSAASETVYTNNYLQYYPSTGQLNCNLISLKNDGTTPGGLSVSITGGNNNPINASTSATMFCINATNSYTHSNTFTEGSAVIGAYGSGYHYNILAPNYTSKFGGLELGIETSPGSSDSTDVLYAQRSSIYYVSSSKTVYLPTTFARNGRILFVINDGNNTVTFQATGKTIKYFRRNGSGSATGNYSGEGFQCIYICIYYANTWYIAPTDMTN